MSAFTAEQQEALRALRKSLPEGLQNREEHDGAEDLARLRGIVAIQSETNDWYASRPSLDGGPTISPEQAEDGLVGDLPHGGVIHGHLTFAQWDQDGTLVLFGLVVDGAEYIVQPVDPEAEGDPEDDES